MVQACNTELNNLKGQLAAAYQQINALKESKEEVKNDALEHNLADVTVNLYCQKQINASVIGADLHP